MGRWSAQDRRRDHGHTMIATPLNSANFPALIGPVKCPSCGWDDGGELRVVDWYDEMYPPIPPPRYTLAVWGDDPERDGCAGLSACPVCDEDFSDPSTMARRET